jgi:Spherulation-specific family 4.
MIALYTYPDSTWDVVAQAKSAHPSVPVVAIINPNNGPGSSRDANYVSGIQNSMLQESSY